MDSGGEGEGEKIWKNGIETCKISCMKQDASPGSMHDTGCLGLVHWDDPEGGYGEGGGRAVNMIYEENLHMISERLQDNLYILPSSIHETIAVPASMGTPEELAEMVHDANMNVVQLSERLSNQVYHHDKDARKLTIATDSQHKRLDGLVSEMPMVYEDKNKGR